MNLTPLGDQAVLASFPAERESLRFASALRSAGISEVIDIVPAYVSVAVYYDLTRIRYAELADRLRHFGKAAAKLPDSATESRQFQIPCCYQLGPDLARVGEHTHLPLEEIIRLHTGFEYTVYAVGFCPGFPYLGYLPEKLCGVPRLPSPRLRVEPGSVGLTGRQTGVYPLQRPGGWNLIGRTPLELVNVADGYFPLGPGDRVRFSRIDEAEFQRLRGKRL